MSSPLDNAGLKFPLPTKAERRANISAKDVVLAIIYGINGVYQLMVALNEDRAYRRVLGKYRFSPSGDVQLFNTTTNKYHTMHLTGPEGGPYTLSFGAGEI